jgi:hypothetical protein
MAVQSLLLAETLSTPLILPGCFLQRQCIQQIILLLLVVLVVVNLIHRLIRQVAVAVAQGVI